MADDQGAIPRIILHLPRRTGQDTFGGGAVPTGNDQTLRWRCQSSCRAKGQIRTRSSNTFKARVPCR